MRQEGLKAWKRAGKLVGKLENGPKYMTKGRKTGREAYIQAKCLKSKLKGLKSRQKSLKKAAERRGSRQESL